MQIIELWIIKFFIKCTGKDWTSSCISVSYHLLDSSKLDLGWKSHLQYLPMWDESWASHLPAPLASVSSTEIETVIYHPSFTAVLTNWNSQGPLCSSGLWTKKARSQYYPHHHLHFEKARKTDLRKQISERRGTFREVWTGLGSCWVAYHLRLQIWLMGIIIFLFHLNFDWN